MEENVQSGGLGEHVAAMLAQEQLPVSCICVAIPNQFVEHGSVEQLRRALGIDADTVTKQILSRIS
jgi:1-deoxy-D-xylulose-5-phosphate synthase